MARRVPLSDPTTVIRTIKEDGGVILTGFSNTSDIERVNHDAAPFINALVEDVRQSMPRPSHLAHGLILPTSAHHGPFLEKPHDARVYSDEVRQREKSGCNNLPYSRS